MSVSLSMSLGDYVPLSFTSIILLSSVGYILYLFCSYWYHSSSHILPTIHYTVKGNKAGPIIILINGWPDLPCYLWQAQVDFFRDDYLCVLIELPNYHCNKIGNPWGYSFKSICDGVANTIQSVVQQYSKNNMYNQQKVILIGHDWGAFISIYTCALYPQLISRLCTLDIGVGQHRNLTKSAKLLMVAYQLLNIVLFLMPPFLGTFCLRRVIGLYSQGGRVGFPILRYEQQQKRKYITVASNYMYFYIYKALITGEIKAIVRALRALPMDKVPFLFVYAGRGPLRFYSEKWLAKLQDTPGCKAVEFDCTHWISVDKPQEFNELLAKWLKE